MTAKEYDLARRLGVIRLTHWGEEISGTHLAMIRRIVNDADGG